MSEILEPSDSSPTNKNPSGRKTKPEYGKMSFRLPIVYERTLRYAALMLETNPNAVSTPQGMVEDAVLRYIDALRKKGIEYREHSTPPKSA